MCNKKKSIQFQIRLEAGGGGWRRCNDHAMHGSLHHKMHIDWPYMEMHCERAFKYMHPNFLFLFECVCVLVTVRERAQ